MDEDITAIDKIKHKTKELVEDSGFTDLKAYNEEKLIASFSTEPMEELLSYFILNEFRLNIADALRNDLTRFIELDFLYRWKNAGDIAINIMGRPNKGKSNMMLYFGMKWCEITGKPYPLSNIVYNTPEFNLLLKGLKVKPISETEVSVESFPLEAGIHMSLDEAGDALIAGPLSMTTVFQTADIEARMRALQIGRFCAGVREILHQAYYHIYAVQRDPIRKEVVGLVYSKETTSMESPAIYLGYVRVPYVSKELFDAYNKPKLQSIKAYTTGVGTNRIAQLIKCFANELWNNSEYQALSLKPISERINWLQRNPKYTIWTTIGYFKELEKLTRNYELFYRLHPELLAPKHMKKITTDDQED